MPFLVLFIIIYLPIERSIFKKSPYVKANNIKVKDEYDLFITNSFRFIIKNQKHKYNLRYNLYNYDYYLLFCLLGKLNKIKFSTDVDNNIKNIKELIYYVDKFVLNEKGRK